MDIPENYIGLINTVKTVRVIIIYLATPGITTVATENFCEKKRKKNEYP